MALTRAMLKAMSIEDEKIDQIIEAHSETVESLKKQRDALKADADKAEELQRKLDEAEKRDGEDFEAKYQAEHDAFEAYKEEVENAKLAAQVEGKYRELLQEVGIDPRRIDAVTRVTDLNEIVLNKDGSIKDAEKLADTVKEEWSDFIAEARNKGAKVENPPTNSGGGMSKQEIMAIKDPIERQRAIAENHELFGF